MPEESEHVHEHDDEHDGKDVTQYPTTQVDHSLFFLPLTREMSKVFACLDEVRRANMLLFL